MQARTSLPESEVEPSFSSVVSKKLSLGKRHRFATNKTLCSPVVYGYYHVSGAKKRMDQLHSVSETFTQVKDKAVQATPSPKAAINFLKSVANSYAGK